MFIDKISWKKIRSQYGIFLVIFNMANVFLAAYCLYLQWCIGCCDHHSGHLNALSLDVRALNTLVTFNLQALSVHRFCPCWLQYSLSECNRLSVTLPGHKVFIPLKVFPPTSLLSGWLMNAFVFWWIANSQHLMKDLILPGTHCSLWGTSLIQAKHLAWILHIHKSFQSLHPP